MLKLDSHSNELALVGRALYASLFVVYGSYYGLTEPAAGSDLQGVKATAIQQPDDILFTYDTRFTSLAWRDNRMVGTQTVRVGNRTAVR